VSNAVANQIWSSPTDPTVINKTEKFSGCDFLLINALGYAGDQFEIAAGIEIEVIADLNLLNGSVSVPDVNLGVKELPLNLPFFDTAIIIPLPLEATRSNCECRVCLSTSYPVNLEIYAVSKKALCDCKNELKEIKDVVDFIRLLSAGIAINQIGQNVSILAFAGTVGFALAPITGGASLALPGAVGGALSSSSGSLIPVLVGAGFGLPVGI
jgi:hypothetical protein